MAIKLDLHQRRVLGVLIEKSMTTPGSYPLTINSIVTGCNQLSCRDPVMQMTEGQVSAAVHQLQLMQILAQVAPDRNARSNRFAHRVEERFGWDTKDRAIMAELFLRGPQTPGELKSNASRMSALDDLGYVLELLTGLAGREPPCVVELPRQPGKAANKFDHCLYAEGGPDAAGGQSHAAQADQGAAGVAAHQFQSVRAESNSQSTAGSTLEQRVAALEAELARVKMTLETLQSGRTG